MLDYIKQGLIKPKDVKNLFDISINIDISTPPFFNKHNQDYNKSVFNNTLCHEFMHAFDMLNAVCIGANNKYDKPELDYYNNKIFFFTPQIFYGINYKIIYKYSDLDGNITRVPSDPGWICYLLSVVDYYCNYRESRAYLTSLLYNIKYCAIKIKRKFLHNPKKYLKKVIEECKTTSFKRALVTSGLIDINKDFYDTKDFNYISRKNRQQMTEFTPKIINQYRIYLIILKFLDKVKQIPAEKLYNIFKSYYSNSNNYENGGKYILSHSNLLESPEKLKTKLMQEIKEWEQNGHKFIQQADKQFTKEVSELRQFILEYKPKH